MPESDDLDFTAPTAPSRSAGPPMPSAPFKTTGSPFYRPEVAERLFRAAGKAERFDAGQTIFAEDQKASGGGLFSMRAATRMYFLAEGEVALSMNGKALDTLSKGEVFGEMAVISERPRTATATAKSACTVQSLNAEGLRGALAKAPDFALMLMSVMFDRIRFVGARLATRGAAIAARRQDAPVFDATLLAQLEGALARPVLTRYPAGAVIMREGQAGMVMYIVKAGRVAIARGSNVVEVLGPGGTFGEMALVDQSPRVASAVAEEECELLAIDRVSLMDAVAQQPAFAMAMLRSIADRLRHMNAHLA